MAIVTTGYCSYCNITTSQVNSICTNCSNGSSPVLGGMTGASGGTSGYFLPSGLGSSGQVTISTGTTSWLHNLWPQSTITPEEVKELAALEEEHKINVKTAKMNEFKKLPKELRQWVIDCITWQKVSQQVGQATVEKSARQIELENKKNIGGIQFAPGTNLWGNPYLPLSMPDGITHEDLEMAHLEASLEEEVIDSE